MKKEIHPVYYSSARVRCVCGAEFTLGSTKESFAVEICSRCHPFYTGKGKIVDTAGRVERFRVRARKKAEGREKTKKQRVKKQKQS